MHSTLWSCKCRHYWCTDSQGHASMAPKKNRHPDTIGLLAGGGGGLQVQDYPLPPCIVITCARDGILAPPWEHTPNDISLAPPPPRYEKNHADTRACEPQNEPGTACWDACSALLRNRLCVPLFLVGVFDSEELCMLNRGQKNGLSSCRRGCHLGSRFGCTLG